jgi:hypothetical protein
MYERHLRLLESAKEKGIEIAFRELEVELSREVPFEIVALLKSLDDLRMEGKTNERIDLLRQILPEIQPNEDRDLQRLLQADLDDALSKATP